jgi:hypothetical protein
LPSISWSNSWSCWFQIHTQYSSSSSSSSAGLIFHFHIPCTKTVHSNKSFSSNTKEHVNSFIHTAYSLCLRAVAKCYFSDNLYVFPSLSAEGYL